MPREKAPAQRLKAQIHVDAARASSARQMETDGARLWTAASVTALLVKASPLLMLSRAAAESALVAEHQPSEKAETSCGDAAAATLEDGSQTHGGWSSRGEDPRQVEPLADSAYVRTMRQDTLLRGPAPLQRARPRIEGTARRSSNKQVAPNRAGPVASVRYAALFAASPSTTTCGHDGLRRRPPHFLRPLLDAGSTAGAALLSKAGCELHHADDAHRGETAGSACCLPATVSASARTITSCWPRGLSVRQRTEGDDRQLQDVALPTARRPPHSSIPPRLLLKKFFNRALPASSRLCRQTSTASPTSSA
ncbi:hypothetical protein ON010_g7235 [Phytophthora cinnamomi]|nr:hypothetical protein ON010_g7235 [Phytophthora cinnamomi]